MKLISISNRIWLLLSLSSSADGFVPFSRTFVKLPKSETYLGYATTSFPDATDPYVILNLEPGVDIKEIKKAYRKMALKYHPDAIRGTEQSEEEKQQANDTFAKINAAYAILTGKSEEKQTDVNSQTHPPKHQRHHKKDPFSRSHFHQQEPHTYQPASKTNRRRATTSSNFHQEDSYFSHSGDHINRHVYESQGRPAYPSATTHGYNANGDYVRRQRKKESVSYGMNLNWGGSVSENVSPPSIDNSVKKAFSQDQSATQDKSTLFNRGDTVHIVHGEHNGKCGPVTSICANILKIEVNSTMSIFVEERHVLSEQAYKNKILADEADYPRPQPSSRIPTASHIHDSSNTPENFAFNATFFEQLKIKYNISDSLEDKNVHVNNDRARRSSETSHVKPKEFRYTQEEEMNEEHEYSDFINDQGINILEAKNMDEIDNHDYLESEECNIPCISFTEGDVVKIMKGSFSGDIGIVMSVYPNILKLDVHSSSVFLEKDCLLKLNPKELFNRKKSSDSIASKTQCPNFPGDLSDKILPHFLGRYQRQPVNHDEERDPLTELDESEMKEMEIEDHDVHIECEFEIEDEHQNESTASDHITLDDHNEISPQCSIMSETETIKDLDVLLPNEKRILRGTISILQPKRLAKVAIGVCLTLLLRRI